MVDIVCVCVYVCVFSLWSPKTDCFYTDVSNIDLTDTCSRLFQGRLPLGIFGSSHILGDILGIDDLWMKQ